MSEREHPSPSGQEPRAPQTPANPPPPPAPPPSQRPKRRWLRRTVIGVLVLLIFVVALVALAPTIASTGLVRQFIVSKINDSLNGRLQVKDWSVGWISGVEVNGLTLHDAQGNVVVSADRAYVPMGLVSAARGDLDLGNTVIENPVVHLVVDDQGRTNLQSIARASPSPQTATSNGPLPNVHGTIRIENPTGTVVAAGVPEALKLDGGKVEITIPSLSGKITNDVQLKLAVGAQPQGTVALSGSVSNLTQDGRLDPQGLAADQKLTIQGIDLAAVAPFLKMARVDATVAGMANGQVTAVVDGADKLSADGYIGISNLSLGGQVLQGDTFRTQSLTIPIQVTRKVGADHAVHLVADTGVEIDQGRIHVNIDAPEAALKQVGPLVSQAIQSALAGAAPATQPVKLAGSGTAVVSVDLNAASLLNQLPHTLRLIEGTQVTGGKLSSKTTLSIQSNGAAVESQTTLSNVAASVQGRTGTLQPINIAWSTNVSGGQNPDLSDIKLKLSSAFMNVAGGGPSVRQINVSGDLDLAKLQTELGQFVQVDQYITDAVGKVRGEPIERNAASTPVRLAGTAQFSAQTSGDVADRGGALATSAKLDVNNLQVSGLGNGLDVAQPNILASYSGTVQRGGGSLASSEIRDAAVVFQAGPQQQRTIDIAANATIDLASRTAPSWNLSRFSVLLPQAQREFGPLLPVFERVTIASGQIAAEGRGSYDGATLKLEQFQFSPTGITIARSAAGSAPAQPILQDYSGQLTAAGSLVRSPSAIEARLARLDYTDQSGMVAIHKSGQDDLVVRRTADGELAPSGSIKLDADLAKINALVSRLSGTSVVASTQGAGELRSGQLSGTIDLAHPAANQTALSGTFNVNGLTVSTYGAPIENQQIAISLKATAPDDLSQVAADSVTVNSSFAKVDLSDVLLKLKGGPDAGPVGTFDRVQKLTAVIDLTDLNRLQSLAEAVMPPKAAANAANDQATVLSSGATGATVAGVSSDAQASPPLRLAKGSVSVRLDVQRQSSATNISVQQIKGDQIVLARGPASMALKPIDLKLAASVETPMTLQGTDRNLIDQISQVRVTALSGSAGLAEISMPEPIVIRDLSGGLPTADGSVRVAGELKDIGQLLDVLKASPTSEPPPYAGSYTLSQKLASQGQTLTAQGELAISNFSVRGTGTSGAQAAFAESSIKLTNDLSIDPAQRSLAIRNVNLAMQSSQALNVSASGTILGYDKQRQFQNVTANVQYDLAKLWAIVYPMLSMPQQQNLSDVKLAGQVTERFTLSGSLPADQEPKQAIRSLVATGAVAVPQFQGKGLDIEGLQLPLFVKDGVAVLVDSTKPQGQGNPPPARCNGGTINLGSATLDLRGDAPRLSVPQGQKILDGIALNKVLVANLNRFLPVFDDTNSQTARMSVVADRVDRLPLGDLMMTAAPQNDGTGQLTVSFADVQLGGPIMGLLTQFNVLNPSDQNMFRGDIPPTKVTLSNGRLSVQDFKLDVGQSQRTVFALSGAMGLAPNGAVDLTATLPPDLVKRFGKEVRQFLPDQIALPIGGTRQHMEFRGDQMLSKLAADAAQKAIVGNLLGGNRQQQQQQPPPNAVSRPPAQRQRPGQQRQQPPRQQQPTQENPGDIIGGFLRQLPGNEDQQKQKNP